MNQDVCGASRYDIGYAFLHLLSSGPLSETELLAEAKAIRTGAIANGKRMVWPMSQGNDGCASFRSDAAPRDGRTTSFQLHPCCSWATKALIACTRTCQSLTGRFMAAATHSSSESSSPPCIGWNWAFQVQGLLLDLTCKCRGFWFWLRI